MTPPTPAWEAHIVLAAADVLNSNQRLSPYARASRVRAIKTVAEQTARFTRAPHLERARLDVEISFPDRKRRDTHNYMPTVKALVDGLVKAGVLPDDDWRHLTGPHLEHAPDLAPKRMGQNTYIFHLKVRDRGEALPK